MTSRVLALALLVVAAAAVAAAVVLDDPDISTDAPKAAFCDYWQHYPEYGEGIEPMSREAFESDAAEFRELGVPADASEQVRESLEMRVELAESWARGELTEDTDPMQGDDETWFALEDYIADEC